MYITQCGQGKLTRLSYAWAESWRTNIPRSEPNERDTGEKEKSEQQRQKHLGMHKEDVSPKPVCLENKRGWISWILATSRA